MRRNIQFLILAAILLVTVTTSTLALSSSTVVSDLMAKSGLRYSQVSGRTDMWQVTYTGLDNADEVDVYVWARKNISFVTIYATVYTIEEEPTKSFLWRLLEMNNDMIPYKYVIWEDEDDPGTYYVDCQVDLPLKGLTGEDIHNYADELVDTLDQNYNELDSLI